MKNGLGPIEYQSGEKVLIYGIGNLGRQDDGLGIRLVEKLEETIEGSILESLLRLESNYQLSIEDALLISEFDIVLFVDATREINPSTPFSLRPLNPSGELAFTTHAMCFSSILSLCEELYARKPRTFLIAIPGYEWEISESLSYRAGQNLDSTFEFLSETLEEFKCMNSH